MTHKPPLVSVVIPTYNRCALIPRAIESVLGQTHEDFEIIVSDNASTDGTRSAVEAFAASDGRIRYVRLPQSERPIANFNNGARLARGAFFMWLADDDWLSSNYLSECLSAHASNESSALATARTIYCVGESESHEGQRTEARMADPAQRVIHIYRTIGDNGAFYGLHRRSRMPELSEHRSVLGFDWIFMARSAFAGAIVHAPAATLYRDYPAIPDYHLRYAEKSGLSAAHKLAPGLILAYEASVDVVQSRAHYPGLSVAERVVLSARILKTVGRRLDFSMSNVAKKARQLVGARAGSP